MFHGYMYMHMHSHFSCCVLHAHIGENKIGRKESDCDVFISSRGLSRVHCSILVDNGEHFIMDHKSSNQTHRHSHCLRPSVFYELTDGCELLLANIRCMYYHGDIPGTSVEQEEDENIEAYEAETDNSTPASPTDSNKVPLIPSSLPAHSPTSGASVGDKAKEDKNPMAISPCAGNESGSSTCGEPSPSPAAQQHGLVDPASPCLKQPSPLPLSADLPDPTLPYSPGQHGCQDDPSESKNVWGRMPTMTNQSTCIYMYAVGNVRVSFNLISTKRMLLF